MQHIKRKELDHVDVCLPPSNIIKSFNTAAESIMNQVQNLKSKTSILTTTRDRLLTRLMSGKIDVEKLDIGFPPGMQEEPRA